MDDLVDLYDILNEYEQEESGGGGIIALTEVSGGYKVYAKGHEQEDTWFSFPAGNDDAKAQAQTKAKAFASANDANAPRFGIQLRCLKDGALSRGVEVTWMNDRFFNADIWTAAAKEVVIPSLKTAGISSLPWKGWARIGFMDDPFKFNQGEAGKTDTDVEGNPRYPQVAYVSEVFENVEAAKASVDSTDNTDTPAGWKPDGEGWTAESLAETADTIVAELKEKEATVVAEEYGLSVDDVLVAAGVHKTSGNPKKTADLYGVEVTDITALRNSVDVIPF